MATLSPAKRAVLFRSQWTPRKLGSALVLWLDASQSPLTMAAGMAADFENGNSEYLSIADNASLSVGDIDFTLAGWVQLESAPANFMTIAGKFNTTANTREYGLHWDNANNRFRFAVSVDGTAIVTALANSFGAPSLATWYFVVGWHDAAADTINIQINDGPVDSTAHATGVLNSTSGFLVGASGAGATTFWDGLQQCLGLWKSVLTAAQRTALYNGGVPLSAAQAEGAVGRGVSYWEMNEPSGPRKDLWGTNDLTDNNTVTTAAGTCLNAVGQINDLSGRGNHASQATQANKPVLRMGANGIGGKPALSFDGVNDVLGIAALVTALAQPYTIAIVGKMRSAGDYIFVEGGDATHRILVESSIGVWKLFAGTAEISSGIASDTSPHVFVATPNGAASLMNIDGVSVSLVGDVGSQAPNGLYLGATYVPSAWAPIIISAVYLINRQLTSQETQRFSRYLGRRHGIAVTA